MKISRHRVNRIRNELRQWLRRRYGVRAQYDRDQIDLGRQELGFNSVDDVLIAYTFFGNALVSDYVESAGSLACVSEIQDIAEVSSNSSLDVTDMFVDS